jgi:hypothetical protein
MTSITPSSIQFANSITEIGPFRNGIKPVLATGQISEVVGSVKLMMSVLIYRGVMEE